MDDNWSRASVRLIYQNSLPFGEYNHVRYDHLQGYLETDVKFQIWPYNTYTGYLETDVKFQIWP